jgi:hypothetical protein
MPFIPAPEIETTAYLEFLFETLEGFTKRSDVAELRELGQTER